MTKSTAAAALLFVGISLCPAPAEAAPGLGGEVYGADVDKGEPELEVVYGRLGGGNDAGEDALKLEAAYGVTDRLRIGVIGEFEKEPFRDRELEAVGVEAIYELGQIGGVQFAAYGEYEVGLEGPDIVETKLLVQHKRGPLDLRLNLIAEKQLASGEPVELEYAASADIETVDDFRVGVQAFGALGTFEDFLPRAEHFVGPVAKWEVEGLGPELELQVGYLFALGAARDDTDGQLRLAIELEF